MPSASIRDFHEDHSQVKLMHPSRMIYFEVVQDMSYVISAASLGCHTSIVDDRAP